jgi:small nuclear ribonucleoprotein (snRNP)-like protein
VLATIKYRVDAGPINGLCSRLIGCLTIATAAACSQSIFATDLDRVTIKTFDGRVLNGSIDKIEASGQIVGTNLPKGLTIDEVVSVESDLPIDKREVYDVALQMIDGGRLIVRNPEVDGETVAFRSGAGLAELPLQMLRAIIWQSSDQIQARVKTPSKDRDAVLVQTDAGERGVEGIVEFLDRERLQINYQGQSRTIGLSKIKAIIMADVGLERPRGLMASIRLKDGSTVEGVIQSLLESQLNVQLSGNTVIALDASLVVGFSIQSDRLVYLSDLEPVDVQQKTEFAVERPWRADRSVGNNPLAIRYGKSERVGRFNKGLGTQAFTQLVFENDGYDRFRAVVGIDAETDGRGDCQMVVRGDGIELWTQRIQGSGNPVPIDVDIRGMERISLVVYPGNDFDLADHADWANARFVRSQ